MPLSNGKWLKHPDFGVHRVPNSPDVLAWFESRGWAQTDLPPDLESDDPDFVELLEKSQATEQVAELKGKELDAALDAAGLSKSGTVEDKRARLADSEASQETEAESATSEEGTE